MFQSCLETRYSSRAKETVVFPAPLRPVNQMVQPRNRLPMTSPRFDLETACFCAYTLVAIVVLWKDSSQSNEDSLSASFSWPLRSKCLTGEAG